MAANKSGKGKGSGDKVGYGKPPKHTRFGKGQSGNPKGRPKGAKNLRTVVEQEAFSSILVSERGKTRKVSKMTAIMMGMMAKGLKGDTKAAQIALSLFEKYLPDIDPENALIGPPSEEELSVLTNHAEFLDLVERAHNERIRKRSS